MARTQCAAPSWSVLVEMEGGCLRVIVCDRLGLVQAE